MVAKTKRYKHRLFFESGTEVEVDTTKSFQAAIKAAGITPPLGDWVVWERPDDGTRVRYYFVKGLSGFKGAWSVDKGGLLPEALANARKYKEPEAPTVEAPKQINNEEDEADYIEHMRMTLTENRVLSRYTVRNSLFRIRDKRVEDDNVVLVQMIWEIIKAQLQPGESIHDFTHKWDVNPNQPLIVVRKDIWEGLKEKREEEIYDNELEMQMTILKKQYRGREIPESVMKEARGRAHRSAERKIRNDELSKVFTGQK